MFSLFRQQAAAPQQSAFRLPDHLQAVQVREPEATVSGGQVLLNAGDEIAADEYLKAQPLATKYIKDAEAAKKRLLASLGPASSGRLPDGRIVSKHIVPVAAEAEPRKAHNRTSISIA